MVFDESNEQVEVSHKSKYNSGVAKEMRRNDLWKDANNHKRTGKFSQWNDDLDCVWCELVADAQKKDIYEEKKTELGNIDKEILAIGQLIDTSSQGFEDVPKDFMKKRAEHYRKLMEKEIFIRLVEEQVGKGTAWEDDDDDEF